MSLLGKMYCVMRSSIMRHHGIRCVRRWPIKDTVVARTRHRFFAVGTSVGYFKYGTAGHNLFRFFNIAFYNCYYTGVRGYTATVIFPRVFPICHSLIKSTVLFRKHFLLLIDTRTFVRSSIHSLGF